MPLNCNAPLQNGTPICVDRVVESAIHYVDTAGCLRTGKRVETTTCSPYSFVSQCFDYTGALMAVCPKEVPVSYVIAQSCPGDAQDREMWVLCAPDGTKVMVQNVTPEGAPIGTAPVMEAWLLNGTPYAGAIADLKDCGAEKVDIAAAQWFCANGQNLSRTDFWDISVSPKVLIGSLWQDASGAVVTSPAPGTATVGTCSVVRKQLIYYRELVGGESLDISSIISDTGATTIHSIQVVHIDGEATLKGDTGSIPLDAFAPIWSHSSISGGDAQDQLTASAWTVVVDAGIVRVSAMYS